MPSVGPNVDFLLLFGLPLLAVIPLAWLLCHIQARRQRRASYGTVLLSITIVSLLWLALASRGDCFTAEFWLSRAKHRPVALWLQLTALVAVTSALPALLVVARYQLKDRPFIRLPLNASPDYQYKPSDRAQLGLMLSFLPIVLPAIVLTGLGYFWLLEHGLKLDTFTRPEGIKDRLLMVLLILPMIPVLLVAILLSSIPWMFIASRLLSWPDLQFYTNQNQKGPRMPLLSDWLDRLWLQMIEPKRPKTPPGETCT